MNKYIKVICLLMVCSLCAAFLPAGAEGVADAGSDLKEVEFPISSGINRKQPILTATVRYGDSLFEKPATEYNHPLAQASMGLAFSNFRRKDLPTEKQGYGVREFLGKIGFTDLQYDQYDIATTSDTVASTIGQKETVIGGEKCTILAVSVCGFGYQNEWLSNFTFSSGAEHEGFTSAADKVLSRLLLYLYNHPTENRLKIWVSGFSRAAAVSNLVGQKLSRGQIIDVEDLYVYTFATPNTSKEDSPWPCPSIFNITGSFDLVPTIPPSEWGYQRYGTTLFLPAQEVVTDYRERRAAVEPIYEKLTGVKYWNSPVANWLLQKFCQVLYSNINDATDYSESFRETLSSIWMSESLAEMIRNLANIMRSNERADTYIRAISSELKTVLSVFLHNYFFREDTGETKYWGDGVPFTAQVMHEHFPDVYYSWMMSQQDPEKLFITAPGYRRIVLSSLLDCEGVVWMDEESLAGNEPDALASMSIGDEKSYTIPMERECVFILRANAPLGDESFIINEYKVGSLEATADVILCGDLEKDDLGYLYLPAQDQPGVQMEYYTDYNLESANSALSVRLEQKNEVMAATLEIVDSGWVATHTLDILFGGFLCILLLIILIIVLVNTRALGRKKVFRARRAFLTLLFLFFLLEQLTVIYFPWGKETIALCKGICGLCLLGVCIAALYRRSGAFEWLITAATLLCGIGDVTINLSFVAGMIFFGLGHMVFLVAFLKDKKPGKKQFAVLIPLVAVLLFIEYQLREALGNLCVPIMIYTALVLSMAVFSSLHSKGIMAGGILFAMSDLLLVIKLAMGSPMLISFVSLFVYYLAMALLTGAVYKNSRVAPQERKERRGPVLI